MKLTENQILEIMDNTSVESLNGYYKLTGETVECNDGKSSKCFYGE